jgi:polyhydroxyalkanoate synthesis regulator phasin
MESELDRRDLGRLLREKEKALVNMLSKHPSAGANSKDLTAIRQRLEQTNLPKNRTTRYESALHAMEASGSGADAALDMQAIVDQTVSDMNIMRDEKNKEIDELKKRLKEKTDMLEDHVSRLKTIKHYGNLLVKSSNIYVHKNPGEVAESDKVIHVVTQFQYSSGLTLYPQDISTEIIIHLVCASRRQTH